MPLLTEEDQARLIIDQLLSNAGWSLCDAASANIHAARGVAVREFPLPGHGFADYLIYLDGKAAGIIEAKRAGVTLTGAETQSSKGLPSGLTRWHAEKITTNYIDQYYNVKRRYSTIGLRSPQD